MFVAYTIRRNKYIATGEHPTREDAARELFTTLPKLKRCTTKKTEIGASVVDDIQWHRRDELMSVEYPFTTIDHKQELVAQPPHQDTLRALAAAQAIMGGRPGEDPAAIMVTLEHAVATVLIALYGDPRKAVGILNEALIQGVEARLAFYASKAPSR